jgi:uncharacterized protein (DUF488 family)
VSPPQHSVFTVGHSNHSPEAFTGLLLRHGVEEVFDVRSSPYSRYTPQFNQGDLTGILSRAGETGIEYTFLGAELGGRPADRSCYDADGRVLYERLADTDLFDDGIRRVMRAADERRVALMCSEKEPLDCHRALLIAMALADRGAAVGHILADGVLEDHDEAMDRLIDGFKLPRHGDMFRSRDDVIADALSRQAKKVAYVGEKPLAGGDWGDAF